MLLKQSCELVNTGTSAEQRVDNKVTFEQLTETL